VATVNDVLLAMLENFRNAAKRRLNDITPEQIKERPAAGVNPVGFTVWHALRGQDRGFGSVTGKGSDGEVWGSAGFHQRTGYDPRGMGFRGIGIGTGFTRSMVDDVPVTKELLVEYTDALYETVAAYVKGLTPDELLAPRPNANPNPANPAPDTTTMQMILGMLNHGLQHLGEADVLRSLHGIPDPTTPAEEE
jgi:hypothetical protein